MKSRRIISMVVLATTTALTLTGCMAVKMDVSVSSDQTAKLNYSVTYDKAKLAELMTFTAPSPEEGSAPEAPEGETSTKSSSEVSLAGICKTLEEDLTSMQLQGEEKPSWNETDESCIATIESKQFSFDEGGITDSPFTDPFTKGIQLKKVEDNAEFSYTTEVFANSVQSEGKFTWDSAIDDFTISVNFPGNVTSVSGGGVIAEDKRSVTWNVDSLKTALNDKQELKAVGGLTPPFPVLPLVLGGVFALVVLGGVAAFFAFRRKAGEKEAS